MYCTVHQRPPRCHWPSHCGGAQAQLTLSVHAARDPAACSMVECPLQALACAPHPSPRRHLSRVTGTLACFGTAKSAPGRRRVVLFVRGQLERVGARRCAALRIVLRDAERVVLVGRAGAERDAARALGAARLRRGGAPRPTVAPALGRPELLRTLASTRPNSRPTTSACANPQRGASPEQPRQRRRATQARPWRRRRMRARACQHCKLCGPAGARP